MTKERKLAIQMWEEVADLIEEEGEDLDCIKIVDYKLDFAERHNLRWKNNCYWCHYVPSCKDCPLYKHDKRRECGRSHTLYNKVMDKTEETEIRAWAARQIAYTMRRR